MDDKTLRDKTAATAALYFKGVEGETPFKLWEQFDKQFSRDMSLHITGKVYAREVIPHQVRQLVTVSALTVLGKLEELELHVQAALNVGCKPREIAETMFQTSVYGGVPAMNQGLKVLRKVLQDKNLWPIDEE